MELEVYTLNSSYLFLIIAYSFIIIRFLIVSFKIITNSKTINFFLFTPAIVNKTNKMQLLSYSLAIVVDCFFTIISCVVFNSYLLFVLSLMVYFALLYNAKKYTI